MDLKKIAFALYALGFCGVASAGGFMPAPACANQPVTVPCEHKAWDAGFTAFWGRITSDYMVMDSINYNLLRVTPGYSFGFGLEGSYHWGNGNDFTVDWTRFHKTFEERGNVPSNSNNERAFPGDVFANEASFHFDNVNFALGQNINVGSGWDLRAHIGGQYLRLNRDLFYRYAELTDFNNGDADVFHIVNEFRGLGARGGLDSAYHMNGNWSLIGNAAISVLSGRLHADLIEWFPSDIQPFGSHEFGKTYAMVAGVDGRVGLRYDHSMTSGKLSVTGGYAGNVYVNTVLNASLGDTDDHWYKGNFGVGSFFLAAKYTS